MIPLLFGFVVFAVVAVILLRPYVVAKLLGYVVTGLACWFVFSLIVQGYLASVTADQLTHNADAALQAVAAKIDN